MQLHALLRQFDPQVTFSDVPSAILKSEITDVTEDSRKARPGSLFIARAGTKVSGAHYIEDARTRGAVAAVVERKTGGCALPQIVVANPARAASVLSNLLHGHPSHTMRCFAVTGTNGKTTSTYILRHLLTQANQRTGMIGTVEIHDGQTGRESDMTTPSACDVAQLLATMRDRGCRSVVMETSSHALDQDRVAGVFFCGAGFTNLTGDHLDYHKTKERYADAKAKLFESLDAESVAVVNDDDKSSDRMIRDCPARIVRFGFSKHADYQAKDIEITSQGSRFTLVTPDGEANVTMKLIGKHNIENVLTAAALAGEAGGLTLIQIAAGLRDADGAPGRLQVVDAGQRFAVLVDYAHTDDALENVLTALRPLTRGKLRVLFGCGGDRDNTKRPRMAKVAEKNADVVYVTSDNPRTEDPIKIVDQIVAGLNKDAIVEPDRRSAIEKIIQDAESDDVVLLAGKGHENYQIIGTEKHHFDDVEEARRVLQRHGAAA